MRDETKEFILDNKFVDKLMENEALEKIMEQGEAFQELMAYYRCAIMEVETNSMC